MLSVAATNAGVPSTCPLADVAAHPTSDIPHPTSLSDSPHPTSDIPHPTSILPHPTSELLLAVAACDSTAPEIADRFNIPLDTYLDWLSSPDTARRLSALIAQAEAVRLKRLEARHDSALETLHALHQSAEQNADPVERRRAATAVARFSIYSRAQSSNISRLFRGLALPPADQPLPPNYPQPTSDIPHPTSDIPHPPSHFRLPTSNRLIRPAFARAALPISTPRPDPAHSPALATTRLLQLLQTCDEPRRGHGLRALFAHFTPVWQSRTEAGNEQQFARAPADAYRTLINHRAAVLHPTEFDEAPDWIVDQQPIRAHQSFDFIDAEDRPWVATFEFSRAHHEPDAPWLINRVQLDPPSEHPSEHPPPAQAPILPGQDVPLSPEDELADDLRLANLEFARAQPPPVYEEEYTGPDDPPSSGYRIPDSDLPPLPPSELPPARAPARAHRY